MSSIDFNTMEDTVSVSGRERFWFGSMAAGMVKSILDPFIEHDGKKLAKIFPAEHYVHKYPTPESLSLALSAANADGKLIVDGKLVNIFDMQMNTLLVFGGDVAKFAARIHGQCEIHTYVEGANREWLSNIINIGLTARVLHDKRGWQSVIDLLGKSKYSPVVLSYSVTDSFPNRFIADYKDNEDGDSWHRLSDEIKWDMAMKELRNKSNDMEMKPTTWNEFYFTNGISAFDIVHYINK